MTKTGKLKGKNAVITGGAGGIGSRIADMFLKEGAAVTVLDSNSKLLAEYRSSRGGTHKGRLLCLKADIANLSSVKKAFKAATSRFGPVDILVNTAAKQKPIGKLVDVSEKDWAACINTNLIGTMLCCKQALPSMIRRKKGKIINFSGGGATFPRPCFSAYASSKAAIVRFGETLSREVREFKIDINTVSPGPVYTRMFREIIEAGKNAGTDYIDAVKVKEESKKNAEYSARLALFLAGKESDGITGRLISSLWDDWSKLSKLLKKKPGSSLFTLRRIDNRSFSEK